jgi:hypothetical protein
MSSAEKTREMMSNTSGKEITLDIPITDVKYANLEPAEMHIEVRGRVVVPLLKKFGCGELDGMTDVTIVLPVADNLDEEGRVQRFAMTTFDPNEPSQVLDIRSDLIDYRNTVLGAIFVMELDGKKRLVHVTLAQGNFVITYWTCIGMEDGRPQLIEEAVRGDEDAIKHPLINAMMHSAYGNVIFLMSTGKQAGFHFENSDSDTEKLFSSAIGEGEAKQIVKEMDIVRDSRLPALHAHNVGRCLSSILQAYEKDETIHCALSAVVKTQDDNIPTCVVLPVESQIQNRIQDLRQTVRDGYIRTYTLAFVNGGYDYLTGEKKSKNFSAMIHIASASASDFTVSTYNIEMVADKDDPEKFIPKFHRNEEQSGIEAAKKMKASIIGEVFNLLDSDPIKHIPRVTA